MHILHSIVRFGLMCNKDFVKYVLTMVNTYLTKSYYTLTQISQYCTKLKIATINRNLKCSNNYVYMYIDKLLILH